MHRRVQGQECNLQDAHTVAWHNATRCSAIWLDDFHHQPRDQSLHWESNVRGECNSGKSICKSWMEKCWVCTATARAEANVMGTGSTRVDDTPIKHDKNCCARSSAQETTSPAN
jgi:hypothetical protein